MKTITIPHQIKNNFIAIISLFIAISALYYNTWRNEQTEKNRNIRTAAFEVLKELGDLQAVINYARYQPNNTFGNPYLAWSHVAMINDLSELLPPPIPNNIHTLTQTWNKHWMKIKTNDGAIDIITNEIDHSRESVLFILQKLK